MCIFVFQLHKIETKQENKAKKNKYILLFLINKHCHAFFKIFLGTCVAHAVILEYLKESHTINNIHSCQV